MNLILHDYQESLVSALTAPGHVSGDRLLVQVATGGGKTLVINEFLARSIQGKRALIVTKDWGLLSQAAWDFVDRYDGQNLIGYVGDGPEAREGFEGLHRGADRPIVYTTIHSWAQRAKNLGRFDYVLIDELHWGEGAALYSKLMGYYAKSSVFIGFTATPRRWTSFKLVDRAYDFAELLRREYLARPIIEDPQITDVSWTPERSSDHGDFTQASLRELAINRSRNRLIVKTYLEGKEKYGKTLVFACNIDHAETLTNMFKARGVRAGVVHYKVSNRQQVIEDFNASNLEVLVNVSMLTHGVNIPSIKTVFLARPTTSDILFSQMIGRGSRKTAGKDVFYIVDFVDNITKYGVPIIRPEGFFGIPRPVVGTLQNGPILDRHAFQRAPFVTMPQTQGYEAIEGLDIQPEQTFGIEFEVGAKNGGIYPSAVEMMSVFKALKEAFQDKLVIDLNLHDHRTWTFKRDGTCGFEITTRVLKGIPGFMEVHDALTIMTPLLDRRGYTVNIRTGTHAHFGWAGVNFGRLKDLLRIVAYYEPAIYSLVSPSRATTSYARSVRTFFRKYRAEGKPTWKAKRDHYLAVNYENLWSPQKTVEVRYHNGTLEAPKILTWVSLWMRIFDRAMDDATYVGDPSRRVPRTPLSPGPRGNVIALARYVRASERLKNALAARRNHVVANSWVRHEKFGKLATKLQPQWERAA